MAANQFLSLPANGDGKTASSASSAWGYGAWVEIVSASANTVGRKIISMDFRATNVPAVDTSFEQLITIGVGASGAEVTKIQLPFITRNDTAVNYYLSETTRIFFPEPIYLPGGQRLAVRIADSLASAISYGGIKLQYEEPPTPPTTVLNTADATAFGADTTPTVEFTGTAIYADDVHYNVQIDTTSGFDVIDSYSESNQNNAQSIQVTATFAIGQSFTGNGKSLATAKFYLKKTGTPTGNMIAQVFASTGTHGTNAKPTGSALATSASVSPAGLTGSYALTTFTFSGANNITLTNGTVYIIVIDFDGGGIGNTVDVGYDDSSSTHAGNMSSSDGTWVTYSTIDAIFSVQTSSILIDKSSVINPPVTETFTASGSWTAPAGVTSVSVEAWGGGGGASGGGATLGGSGGGGGAYSKLNTYSVTPGNSYSYVVGALVAGVGTSNNGTAGNDSYFVNTSTLLAKGGAGGIVDSTGGAGGASASGVGDTKFSGGAGGNAATSGGAGGGAGAGTSNNGAVGGDGFSTGNSGGTGTNGGGNGGSGASSTLIGSDGFAPGGGGGAGGSLASSGGGARGLVKITYTPASDAGFVNTVNGGDTAPFTSGQKVSYTVQTGSELTTGTYYWRARAIDPNGSNTYGAWPATRSFTISAGGGTTVTPTTAALTLATFAPTITISNNQSVTPSTSAIVTSAFAPVIKLVVTAGLASLALSTFAPSVTASNHQAVTPATAALSATTFAPTVTTTNAQLVTPATASLTTTAYAPTVTATNHQVVTPATATLTTATFAPQIKLTVTPPTAALSLATFAPSINTTSHQTVTPTTYVMSTVTYAPTVTASNHQLVIPTTRALATTTFAPSVSVSSPVLVTPTTATLTITRFAPAVTTTSHQTATPTTLALATTTFAPTASLTDHQTVTPSTAGMTTAMFVPTVSVSKTATPSTASLIITLFAPEVGVSVSIIPGTASLIILTFAPAVYDHGWSGGDGDTAVVWVPDDYVSITHAVGNEEGLATWSPQSAGAVTNAPGGNDNNIVWIPGDQ